MGMFRDLRADEIDCRVSQIKVEEGKIKWVGLLLYKDARCDQNVLDETFGPFGWQKKYTRDNRNCIVSVWDDKKQQWIEKEDTGTESNTEKEKGLASDSFKRACFCWGIGRALYTAPFICIPAEKTSAKLWNGKPVCYDNFVVTGIDYKNGNICFLTIKNNKTGKECFRWGERNKEAAKETEKSLPPDNEPEEFVRPNENTANVTVTPVQKVPDQTTPAKNPVFEYLGKEKAFMQQMFQCTKLEMDARFNAMRNSLIAGGVVENVPYNKMTMDQAKNLIEAIQVTYMTDKDKKEETA